MNVLIVVATHDRLEFLNDALDSIAQQTRQADQVVITGNVGQDFARDYLFVFSEENISRRVNRAIENSPCHAFILLCDDDKLAPAFVEKTAAVMEQSDVDAVYTDLQWFGDCSEYYRCGSPPVTSLVRKSSWEKAGRFYEGPYFDWDFLLSCKDAGCDRYAAVHEPLFLYRGHPGQDRRNITPEQHERYCAIVRARHKEK